jgi:hypothetical protein
VKFTLEDISGNNLNVTSLKIKDIAHNLSGGTSFIIQSPLIVEPENPTNVLYVAISGLYDSKISDLVLTATADNGDTYTYTKPYDGNNSVHFNHGNFYAITVKMSHPIDLSDPSIYDEHGMFVAQNGDKLTGTFPSDKFSISIANGAKVILSNVNIVNNQDFAGLDCQNATIVLEGTNTVSGDGIYPGIFVKEGCTLTIQGNGSLTATGSGSNTSQGNICGAGIGGINAGGNVDIKGGTIIATGGSSNGYGAAGIGCGYHPNGSTFGTITIEGGDVTATAGTGATAIGTGSGTSTCTEILIKNTMNSVTMIKSGADGNTVAREFINATSVKAGSRSLTSPYFMVPPIDMDVETLAPMLGNLSSSFESTFDDDTDTWVINRKQN